MARSSAYSAEHIDSKTKRNAFKCEHFKTFPLVDLKGIEPSNLTDANRALSQLSYKPVCPQSPVIITQIFKM